MLEPCERPLRRMFRQRRDNKDMAGGNIAPAAVEYKLRIFPKRPQPVRGEFHKHGFYYYNRFTSLGATHNIGTKA
jgi:hypothetical protein